MTYYLPADSPCLICRNDMYLVGGKDCRDYGIKDQMFRASVSIASNIAEGSERNSIPDFQRFLNIAKGYAAELRTQVYISREINIFSNNEAKELILELKSISKMLQALSNSLKKTVNPRRWRGTVHPV